MVPASNFLIDDIDDNFSDTNDAVNDVTVPLLAETTSKEDPTASLPIDPIEVPVDTHPTADSCVTVNSASSMLLPSNATAAGGGGDDDSIPPSDDAYADDDNESQQSNHATADGDNEDDNESQKSYRTCDGDHSDLYENCFEIVPTNLTNYRSVGSHRDGVFGPLPTQISIPVADIVLLALGN